MPVVYIHQEMLDIAVPMQAEHRNHLESDPWSS